MFRKELKVFNEYPICTECKQGHMEATGESDLDIDKLRAYENTYIPGEDPDYIVYTHKCTLCGSLIYLSTKYPTIVYEEI